MNKQKVKDFIEAHKKGIILNTGVVVGTIVLSAVGVKVYRKVNGIETMPGFTIEGGLTIKDLGKLGEEYLKHDKELSENTRVLSVGHFKFE